MGDMSNAAPMILEFFGFTAKDVMICYHILISSEMSDLQGVGCSGVESGISMEAEALEGDLFWACRWGSEKAV